MNKILLLSAFFLVLIGANAQVGASTKVTKNRQAYIDSLKNMEYNYVFPIWGKKAYERGFDVPYPAGVMVNTLFGSQEMVIENLMIGANGGGKVPFDFVQFGEVKAGLNTVNVRADIWVLPFMNVYGLFGRLNSTIDVNLINPINITASSAFSGNMYGIGTTVSTGFYGGFFTMDINNTWTYMEQLDKPVSTFMLTPRFGMLFPSSTNPQRNIAVWAGLTYLSMNNTISGSIQLADLGLGISQERLDEIKAGTEQWYQDLGPAQKIIVDQIVDKIQDKLDNVDLQGFTIDYQMNKRPISKLSMVVGGQYQFNKVWQARCEAGFLGGRSTVLFSLNYRFCI